MPGYELIDYKEKLALIKIFKRPINIIGKDKIFSFEEKIKQIVNSKYCQVVTSGTAATKIALKAVGVKRGDEVITQAFNFIATVEAIHELGAKPILTNIDDSLNMDIDDLANKITKKTKAIIPVHMLGVPCNMEKILKISKKYKIPIIEDNCESFGAKYKKKYLGTLGDAGILSFDGGKTVTTGEGGAILTNKKRIYTFANQYQDHGHENNPRFVRGMDTSSMPGFNYRFTQLQAVFGIEQIKKLKKMKKDNKKKYMILKKEISKKYEERKIPKFSDPLFDCYIFKVKKIIDKKKILKKIKEIGIGTKNLPDAIKWHCAYYWQSMIDAKQIKYLKYSRDLLNQHIAIPIFHSKSTKYYKKLAIDLSRA